MDGPEMTPEAQTFDATDLAKLLELQPEQIIGTAFGDEGVLFVATTEGPYIVSPQPDRSMKVVKIDVADACNFVPDQSKNAAQSTPKSYTDRAPRGLISRD